MTSAGQRKRRTRRALVALGDMTGNRAISQAEAVQMVREDSRRVLLARQAARATVRALAAQHPTPWQDELMN